MTYDRWFLLGEKRNELLALWEVEQYGLDNFGDPDYLSLYGLPPREWYARGVRILGRTAVECTRDRLADRIGRDVAAIAGPASSVLSLVGDEGLRPQRSRPERRLARGHAWLDARLTSL